MRRKKEYDYFKSFTMMTSIICQAAKELESIVNDYSLNDLEQATTNIKILEHQADEIKHEIMLELYDAFITPLDREDIAEITECLDDIIDAIYESVVMFSNYNVESIRPQTSDFIKQVVHATNAMHATTKEFVKFKNSKVLHEKIREVNQIEGDTDELFNQLLRDLFINEKATLEIVKWKDIYNKLEDAVDTCETAVDIMNRLIIKNT